MKIIKPFINDKMGEVLNTIDIMLKEIGVVVENICLHKTDYKNNVIFIKYRNMYYVVDDYEDLQKPEKHQKIDCDGRTQINSVVEKYFWEKTNGDIFAFLPKINRYLKMKIGLVRKYESKFDDEPVSLWWFEKNDWIRDNDGHIKSFANKTEAKKTLPHEIMRNSMLFAARKDVSV